MDEHRGYSGTARSGGVVVQPGAGEVEELTAHARPWVASEREDVYRGACTLENRTEDNAGRHDRDGPRCVQRTR